MNEQDYLDIAAYLQGELPPEKAAVLEARAAADGAFAEALAQRRQLMEHLRATAGEEPLLTTLAQLNAQFFDTTEAQEVLTAPKEAIVKPIGQRRREKRWFAGLAVAAAVALLLFFGGEVLFPPADVYEQFAQHQPLSLTERGDGDNGLTATEQAYNEGRYAEAINGLENYLGANPEDARAKLALGVALIEEFRTEEALRVLEPLASGQSTVAPYANWYLALAAVRTGDKAGALRRLNAIPPGDGYLATRVKDLKEVLELE